MAITKNAPSVSWDDLMAAIDPQPLSPEENLRRAIEIGVQLHQEGQVTDEEIELLIKEAIADLIGYEVNDMVGEFLSPLHHRMRREEFPSDFSLS